MFRISLISLTTASLFLVACGGTGSDSSEIAVSQNTVAHDIRGDEIRYESDGVTLHGYVAYDAARAGPRPGVLIVHEWWGHNDYVRKRARMLAELGYTALAIDMYGNGRQAAHPDDAQKFMMEIMNNMASAEARFLAAKSLLENHSYTDPQHIAAIGYCFGGAVVLHMARIGADLDGVASFHGSLGTASSAAPGAIKARILVANGADDPFVPAGDVEAFKAEMEAAGADLKFISYPGVVHSFTNPGATQVGEQFDMPLRYDEAADRASWSELQAFLSDSFAN
jgi:dienelactone hydrolase